MITSGDHTVCAPCCEREDEDWLSFIFCNLWTCFMLPKRTAFQPFLHSSTSSVQYACHIMKACYIDFSKILTKIGLEAMGLTFRCDKWRLWVLWVYESYESMSLMSLWVLHGKSQEYKALKFMFKVCFLRPSQSKWLRCRTSRSLWLEIAILTTSK